MRRKDELDALNKEFSRFVDYVGVPADLGEQAALLSYLKRRTLLEGMSTYEKRIIFTSYTLQWLIIPFIFPMLFSIGLMLWISNKGLGLIAEQHFAWQVRSLIYSAIIIAAGAGVTLRWDFGYYLILAGILMYISRLIYGTLKAIQSKPIHKLL